jgi:hypothetical protein
MSQTPIASNLRWQYCDEKGENQWIDFNSEHQTSIETHWTLFCTVRSPNTKTILHFTQGDMDYYIDFMAYAAFRGRYVDRLKVRRVDK